MNSRLDSARAIDRGTFLGQLAALFGRPSPRDGGFEFYVRDQETQLDFLAYVGPRGPSYGGDVDQRNALRPVLEALEQLLDQTPPIDCAIEYVRDVEGGRSTWIVGCTNGRSFDVAERRTCKRTGTVERRRSQRGLAP